MIVRKRINLTCMNCIGNGDHMHIKYLSHKKKIQTMYQGKG